MKPIEEITKRLELAKEQLVDIEANHKVYNDEDHWYNQIESAEYDTLIRTLEWVLRP